MSAEIRAAYKGPYNSWRNRIATLRFVQDIPLREGERGYNLVAATAAQLPAFASKPTLVGWGLRDFVFDEPFYREWQRQLPEAELHPYADCGHYILEDAGEPLHQAIERFLDRQHHDGRDAG